MCALALWYEIFQHIGRSFNTLSICKPPWATSKEAFIFLIEGERTQPRCRSPPPAFMYANSKSGNRKENVMNAEMKNYVIKLLETYHDRERMIAVLRYDLEHPAKVNSSEQIEAMNYGCRDDIGNVKGHISNKTLYIALNYEEQAGRLNAEAAREVADELFGLEQQQKKLLYYVSLLEKRQANVIHLVYMERLSTKTVAERYSLTSRTIDRIKREAIEDIAEMYACSDRNKR